MAVLRRPVGTFSAGEVLTRLYGTDYIPKEPIICRKFCLRFGTDECKCKALPAAGCGEFESDLASVQALDSRIDSVQRELSAKAGRLVRRKKAA